MLIRHVIQQQRIAASTHQLAGGGALFNAITMRRSLPAPAHNMARERNMAKLSQPPSSQQQLVDGLIRRGILQNPQVMEVMRKVDRAKYSPLMGPPGCYMNVPLPIGRGQTISAPSIHAMALELLLPVLRPGAHVLDAGAGSGFLTTCLALLVGPTGRVVGVDKHRMLAEQAASNILSDHPQLISDGRVSLIFGNVLEERFFTRAGVEFDAIHVGAAAPELPTMLLSKLKKGGRMVIPIGQMEGDQVLQVVDKDQEGQVQVQNYAPVRFVPLTPPPTETLSSPTVHDQAAGQPLSSLSHHASELTGTNDQERIKQTPDSAVMQSSDPTGPLGSMSSNQSAQSAVQTSDLTDTQASMGSNQSTQSAVQSSDSTGRHASPSND